MISKEWIWRKGANRKGRSGMVKRKSFLGCVSSRTKRGAQAVESSFPAAPVPL